MVIAPDLARFIAGPVLMTLGTRDASNRPMIARGSGGRVAKDSGRVEVAVSARLWPETIANVRDNGMFTVTFVEPATYRAFQLKGRAVVRDPDATEVARAWAFVAETERLMTNLGVPIDLTRYWLTAHDVMIVSLAVDRAFEQTPGPRAGVALA
ncbi:pyridoxamine 5'-phosphate oxidase family protein [Amaricoccus sp.]|uniref:pyridoxamine 5'-phosphate oxidase family protein n=1 Tax=Amaricoccus sp. TaxID=1872485 RepID=UPI002615FD77|nr:pyridoxamine 5'-phosphate oxidase family protein [uncultured Amaricoccus sp.]